MQSPPLAWQACCPRGIHGTMLTFCCVPGPLPRAACDLFNLILQIAAIFQMKRLRLHSVALSQRSSFLELCFSLPQLWRDTCQQLRLQEDPCLPIHHRHPFSWEDPPGKWVCFSSAPCTQSSYSITCFALPAGTFKAPALTVKLLCDFIHLISFEHRNSGCCPPSICCYLFPGPATFLITGVVTSANKHILVILVGFWQPVIPQPKFSFTLVTASHIQALSIHPASRCQMHLAQQLSVAPHCLNNCGQGLWTNVYNPLCSGTTHFLASLQCFLCTCSRVQLNQPTVLSSKLHKGWSRSPSPFPCLETPALPQDSANMLDLLRTSFMSFILIPSQGQDFSGPLIPHGCASRACTACCPPPQLPVFSSSFLYSPS